MSVQPRFATIEDIDTLVKVRFDYFAAENWDVSPEQRDRIENNLRQYYAQYLNHDLRVGFVEVDQKVASVAFLAIFNKPANLTFPTGRTGTVFNVLTYPEYRKKGYATSVLNLLLDWAKKQDLSYVELSASDSGKPVYQKLGFTVSEPSEHFTDMKLSLL